MTFIPLLYHSSIIQRQGGGSGRGGHCLCPRQKQWKRVGSTLHLWSLRVINSGKDEIWDPKHIHEIWHFAKLLQGNIILHFAQQRDGTKSLWVIWWALTGDNQAKLTISLSQDNLKSKLGATKTDRLTGGYKAQGIKLLCSARKRFCNEVLSGEIKHHARTLTCSRPLNVTSFYMAFIRGAE